MGFCRAPKWEVPTEAGDPFFEQLRRGLRQPTDEELQGTAIVTMAAGDEAARMVTALVQSIRDVGTRIPRVHVMLMRQGHGSEWCKDEKRRGYRGWTSTYTCSGPTTLAEDIVSPQFLLAWERMGVTYQVMDPMPEKKYSGFAGNRADGWGMAMNKLLVFTLRGLKGTLPEMPRKLIWLDSDSFLQHNIDHLVLLTAPFSSGVIQDCGSGSSGFNIGGGIWVLDVSIDRYNAMLQALEQPVPYTTDGVYKNGDMQLVAAVFGDPTPATAALPFPYIRDGAGGVIPGMRMYQQFRDFTPAQLVDWVKAHSPPAHMLPALEKGELPEGVTSAPAGKVAAGILDPRYEAYVGNCADAVKEKTYLGADLFNVHYTCLPSSPLVHKPAAYKSEEEFMQAVTTRMPACMRYHALRWYDAYTRAMQTSFSAPLWKGPAIARAKDDALDAAYAATLKTEGVAA